MPKPGPKTSWIDISAPVRDGMVHWPGDTPVNVRRTSDLMKGDSHNLSALTLGSHTGTHIDAPAHFLPGGAAIDAMPLSATIGPARVIEDLGVDYFTAENLERHRIRKGDRILLRTRTSLIKWYEQDFRKDYVYLTSEAAEFLAGKQVRCVGIDYLSIGGYRKDGADVHRSLLGAGVWIIEGLNLGNVLPGNYYLVCLPLRLADCDGAPARAALGSPWS